MNNASPLESRPGVTSNILSPTQAAVYMERVLEKEPRIRVAGIAGPGNPFANASENLATLRAIRENHPQMLLCVSSNCIVIPEIKDQHIEEVARTMQTLGVDLLNRMAMFPNAGPGQWRRNPPLAPARPTAWRLPGGAVLRGRRNP